MEEYTAVWQVPYEKGEIVVKANSDDGTEMTASEHSFGDSRSIILEADKNEILVDGEDLLYFQQLHS